MIVFFTRFGRHIFARGSEFRVCTAAKFKLAHLHMSLLHFDFMLCEMRKGMLERRRSALYRSQEGVEAGVKVAPTWGRSDEEKDQLVLVGLQAAKIGDSSA